MDSLQPVTGAGSFQRPSRSHQMVGCLRESMLYSEKRARDMLFNAVEQIVSLKRTSRTGPFCRTICWRRAFERRQPAILRVGGERGGAALQSAIAGPAAESAEFFAVAIGG